MSLKHATTNEIIQTNIIEYIQICSMILTQAILYIHNIGCLKVIEHDCRMSKLSANLLQNTSYNNRNGSQTWYTQKLTNAGSVHIPKVNSLYVKISKISADFREISNIFTKWFDHIWHDIQNLLVKCFRLTYKTSESVDFRSEWLVKPTLGQAIQLIFLAFYADFP